MPLLKLSESTEDQRQVFFTCVNVEDVNEYLQESDMSDFVVYITKKGGTPIIPDGDVCVEVGATHQLGVFYLQLDATDLDQLGRLVITVTNTGGSKAMKRRDINCQVVAYDPYDAIRGTAGTAVPQVASGSSGALPTTGSGANQITVDGAGAVNANTVKHLGTAYATPTTAGYPRMDVHAMESGVLTFAAIANDARLNAFGILDSGTLQGGSTTTAQLATGASSSNGRYQGAVIVFVGSTGALQLAVIDSYVGATRVATLDRTLTTAVANTTTYVVLAAASGGGSSPTAAANAAAVWSALGEGSNTYGDLIRLMTAILSGPARDFTTGIIEFKSPVDGTVRLTVTTDDTGRLTCTLGTLT